jgi:hypothetical protein
MKINKNKKPNRKKPSNHKLKPMEPKIFTETEKGNLGRIRIYHTGEFTHTDIANQVVHCLNEKGYGVYIKSDSFDSGAHVGNGTMSPSVNVCPIDNPGMGFGPHGYMYGTTVINSGFAEVSHPGIRQSLINHFQSLETCASA